MTADLFLDFDAVLVATAAAVTDVRQRRIPNAITYPAMMMGLVMRSYFFGWHGLTSAVGGFVLAGAILLVFYSVKAMGAGDVKLMAAIGSIVGFSHAGIVLIATAIAGGVLAVAYMTYRGRFGVTLRSMGSVLMFHGGSGLQTHPQVNLDNPSALRMPYGLAIAAGTLYAFLAIR